jgi:hypothetical protein
MAEAPEGVARELAKMKAQLNAEHEIRLALEGANKEYVAAYERLLREHPSALRAQYVAGKVEGLGTAADVAAWWCEPDSGLPDYIRELAEQAKEK